MAQLAHVIPVTGIVIFCSVITSIFPFLTGFTGSSGFNLFSQFPEETEK
jgi:hypothetical protein